MCVHIEPTWYKPLDDNGEEYGDTLYFGCHHSGVEHEAWLGSVEQEGDEWRWRARIVAIHPQRLTGTTRGEADARKIVEAFIAADELAPWCRVEMDR